MRDWNLRVFLKRIWGEERLGARSWAVAPALDLLERDFWRQTNVEGFAITLEDYVDRLHEELRGLRGAPA
jgi:hypothetical protein